jgi:TonB family protein
MRLSAVLLLLVVFGLSPAQEISHTIPPKVIQRAEPGYTKEALEAKLQGNVILSFLVGKDGAPSGIQVVRGLGMGLDEKAVECLKLWRWKPATRYGEPVSTKATLEMTFRLPGSDSPPLADVGPRRVARATSYEAVLLADRRSGSGRRAPVERHRVHSALWLTAHR